MKEMSTKAETWYIGRPNVHVQLIKKKIKKLTVHRGVHAHDGGGVFRIFLT